MTNNAPNEGAEPHSRSTTILIQTFNFLLDQWLVLAMGVVIMLAYFFPTVGKTGGSIRSEYTITYGAVAIIFLVSGLTLPLKKLLTNAVNWRLHLIVQVTSLLVIPAVFFGVATGIESAGNGAIESSMLVGLVTTACLPTTISSNVVMTKAANGDDAATMTEVSLGNILGAFISPILISKVFLPAVPSFAAWLPPGSTDDLSGLYARVMMQMGLSVFVPLFVGQVIQYLFPNPVKTIMTKYKVSKIGSFCLLSIIWSTFCTAFATKSLSSVPHATIILNVFLNFILCILFTGISFYLARPPMYLRKRFPRLCKAMPKETTIAVCFCAPAKSQAMGIPMVQAMWRTSSDLTRARIQVPIVLYTAEGILIAQVFVFIFRRWLERDKVAEAESDVTTSEKQDEVASSKSELEEPHDRM